MRQALFAASRESGRPSGKDGKTAPSGLRMTNLPDTDLVVVRNISKSFGEARALQSCSLSARAGEVHAIVGENGSGKSTMVKILAGVLSPDSGTLEVNGITPTNPDAARSMGVEVVFQEILIAEGATVLDNLFLGTDGLFRARLQLSEKRERARGLLDRLVGAPVDLDALIDDLPLSTRQWIVIARALLERPRLAVFDESTAALDHSSGERFLDVVRQLRADGVCVLIVTHRIQELMTICDRATVLRGGTNVGTLSGDEITEARLLEMMQGDSGSTKARSQTRNRSGTSNDLLRISGLRLLPNSDPIDLNLGAGEIVGLAGLEGQGQAEFMEAILGYRESAEGVVTALSDGQFCRIETAHAAGQAGMAYIPGDRKSEGLFSNLSVFENFGIGLYRRTARVGLIDWKRIKEMFSAQVSRLSIRMGNPDAPINSLSGGNQQKVVVARSLATAPMVVALNDPTRGVDIGAKHDLYALLQELAAAGKAVLFLSNEIEEFVGLCDRVVVFRARSVFRTLMAEDISSDAVLAAMFGYDTIKGMEDAER